MIFINRKRIKNNQKDVSKYWYVEKYVYGILKETVEIPLGTGIAFESIDSGYDDDTFYGWSLASDSTSISFYSTGTYSNTTNAVKKNLDENNTLKLYAVYRYNETYISSKEYYSNDHLGTINVTVDGQAIFDGESVHVTGTPPNHVHGTPSALTLSADNRGYIYAKIDDEYVYGTFFYHNPDYSTISKSVKTGQTIKIKGYRTGTSSSTGVNEYVQTVYCTVPILATRTKYRVESHS